MIKYFKHKINRVAIRWLTSILRSPDSNQLLEAVADNVERVLDRDKIRHKLWHAANVRPNTPEYHWSAIPNNIREERMRIATRSAAEFVQQHMPHLADVVEPHELLVHSLNEVDVDGLFLEFGVFSGRSINLIAGQITGDVHGFDSFQGIPEQWGSMPAGTYSTSGTHPNVSDNVHLHVGWFEDTLPKFLDEHPQPVAFVHIDSDLYSSANTVLWGLKDRLRTGSIIVFDEYFNYPYWREHEYRAFAEFVDTFGIAFEYIGYAVRGYSVAVKILEMRV